jgi:hypothetical protein
MRAMRVRIFFDAPLRMTGGEAQPKITSRMLFEALGVKAGQLIVLGRIADLNGTAADFTIFDVDLTRNGEIQNHRDFFATVRAHESMFHCYTEC